MNVTTDEIMDFSEPKNTVPFRVDDDTFHLELSMPVLTAFEYMKTLDAFDEVDGNDLPAQLELIEKLLGMVLREGETDLFVERMADQKNPITYTQFRKILDYATGKVMGRPTTPPESSSGGSDSPESGTASTESLPPEESTPGASLSIAS